MSVTQDYKTLTLTADEFHAVRNALQDRITMLTELVYEDGTQNDEIIKRALANAQTAYAKVRA